MPDPEGRWIFPGRRLLLAGDWNAGLREIWAHGMLVLHRASLLAAGTELATASGTDGLEFGGRFERPGGVTERWTSSLTHAVGVWDAEGPSGAQLTMQLSAPGAEELHAAAADAVQIALPGARVELRLARGDTLAPERAESEGPTIVARGRGALRLVVLVGRDEPDLERARRFLARRGVSGVLAERAQHVRLLADYGVSIDMPDAAAREQFERAKHAADALLVEDAAGGRSLAAGYRTPFTRDWYAHGPAVAADAEVADAAGAALLAAGLRDPVRDTLRTGAAAGTPLPMLAARYAAWTGDATFADAGSAAAAVADAGSVPFPRAHETTDSRNPVPVYVPILAELGARWGLVAEAGRGLGLVPELPDEWPRAALTGVRVGATVLDVEVRRRYGQAVVRLHRRHGPAVAVAAALPGPPPLSVTADGVELGGGRAVIEATDRHEILFQR